jgi:hypothetical protein
MILIGLLMATSSASSMTLTQHIEVSGDGTMSSRAVNYQASENLEATGDQVLDRTLNQGDADSSLSSTYELRSTPYKKLDYNGSFEVKGDQDAQTVLHSQGNVYRNFIPNHYQIRAINPSSLTHLVGIQGFDKVKAISKTSYGKEISTDFKIFNADGTLSEYVVDIKSGKYQPIAETSLSGDDFSFHSTLTDDALIIPESSLLNKLDKSNMSGENSVNMVQDPIATRSVNPKDFEPLVGLVQVGSSADKNPTNPTKIQDTNGNEVLRTKGAENCTVCPNNSGNSGDFTFDREAIGWATGEGLTKPAGEPKGDILVGQVQRTDYWINKTGDILFVVDKDCSNIDDGTCKNYVHIQSKFPTVNQLHAPQSVEFGLLRKPILKP